MSVNAAPATKYLQIYLNDHLMGSTTGTELTRRIAHEYSGTDLGVFAEGLAVEIVEYSDALVVVIDRVVSCWN